MKGRSAKAWASISDNRWHWRWCVLPSGRVLHRITRIPKEDRRSIQRGGKTSSVCGLRGRFGMPGVFSRMGLARCKHCCRIVAIPQGNGAPRNKLTGKDQSK